MTYTGAVDNLRGRWSSTGGLIVEDYAGNAVLTVNPSTGGVLLGNGGGLTVSTGIVGGLTVSSGITLDGTLTISTGYITYNGIKTANITTDTTLTATSCGVQLLATVSDTLITLPYLNSGGKPLNFSIISALTTAGTVSIITATGDTIVGPVGSTAPNIYSNTGATHTKGDAIVLFGPGSSTSWSVLGLIGTWASTT